MLGSDTNPGLLSQKKGGVLDENQVIGAMMVQNYHWEKISTSKNLSVKNIWGLRSLLKCVRIFVHDAEPEKITYD